MLGTYREILRIPGALRFSLAAALARVPMSMVGIAVVLTISKMYGSYTLAGQVSAANVLSFALAVPYLSRAVDRYGQRKVMLPAALISGVTLALLGLAAFFKWPTAVIFGLAIISGGSSGSFGALARSRWAYVLTKPGMLPTAFAWESAVDELIFIMGPVLATLLCVNVHPIAGLLVPAVLAIMGGFWFTGQRGTEPPPCPKATAGRQRPLLFLPVIAALAFIYLLAGVLFGACDLAVVAFATEHGVRHLSGTLLALFAVSSFISAIWYGSRPWASPLYKRLVWGVLALGLSASTFIFAHSVWILALALFACGFAISPTMTNENNMIQRSAPSHRLTEALSWMSTAMNAGVAFGAFIGGIAVDNIGSRGGFWVVTAFAWAMVAATLIFLPVLRRSEGHRANRTQLPE